MPTWPGSLPQNFQLGNTDQRGSAVARFTVDAGPAKTRRLFANPNRRVTDPIVFSQAQRDAFDAFFVTTLREGALSFDWKDPSTDVPRSYRFLSPPNFVQGAGGAGRFYTTTLDLELLP